jgi:chemotaxis protein methyltransferase WspC
VRAQVEFRQGNILTADLNPDDRRYDAIFCRNLLIYFDRETQERIMVILKSLLSPEGFLFVGASETYLASTSGFSAVKHPMAFAFRNATTAITETPLQAISRVTRRPTLIPALPVAAAPKPSVAPPAPIPQATDLAAIERLAGAGNLRAASEQCEAYIRESPSSPAAWYLLGVLNEALGDWQSALDCYRKLLYLEPEHVEALAHLMLLTERYGDPEAVARVRARARRIESRRTRTVLPLR